MTTQTETNQAIFLPVQEFIHTEMYTDADLLGLIAHFIGPAPAIATAMALHAKDILTEMGDIDLDYTTVVSHVYWRTYFSPDHATKYGTDSMVNDPIKLQQLASYLVNPATTHINDFSSQAVRLAH